MHSWVTSDLLDDQLAAERYTPAQVANIKQLRDLGAVPLASLINQAESNYGVLPPSEAYVSSASGVGLVRGGDLDHGHIRHPEVFAPISYASQRGTINKDDVLILAKGACIDGPAGVGLVTERLHGKIFNGTSYRVRFTKADPAYFAAYCLTSFLLLQKTREISNTGVSYNSEDAINAFRVYCPAADAQTYIGNKIRQAEALRAQARGLEEQFYKTVGVVVPPPNKPARFTRISAGHLGEDLNPGRYDPDRLKVREALIANGAVAVKSFARILTPTAEPNNPSQFFLGLDGISSNSIDVTFESVSVAGVGGTCRKLCKGPAISKLRPYLNKVTYVSADMAGALGSTELLCVESIGLHPAFVYGVLKLDTTTRQLNPIATGATHPRVSSSNVLEVLVPTHDKHESLGRSLETAQYSYAAARRLTLAARLLVEALIERKVTEAELVAAHKSGDADRALMTRLTGDGIDIAGVAPLFADFDRLDELLGESQRKEGSDA